MSQEPRKTAAGALLGAMAVVCAPAAFVQSGAVQSLTGPSAPTGAAVQAERRGNLRSTGAAAGAKPSQPAALLGAAGVCALAAQARRRKNVARHATPVECENVEFVEGEDMRVIEHGEVEITRRQVAQFAGAAAGVAAVTAEGEAANAEEVDKAWVQYDLNTGETLYDVDFDTKDPMHGFVVGARGLFYETKDGGRRWVSRSFANLSKNETINYRFQNVSVCGNDVWIVGKPTLLLVSKDGGKSWKKVPVSRKLPGEPKLLVSFGDGKAEMATSSGAVYTTENAGKNWTSKVKETVDATLNRVSSSGVQGASYFTGSVKSIKRDPSGKYVAVAQRGNFYLTFTPGDERWVPHNRISARRIQAMGFRDTGNLAPNDGVWMSLNGGTLTQCAQNGYEEFGKETKDLFKQSEIRTGGIGIIDVGFRSPLEGWAVGGSGVIYLTKDGGKKWSFDPSGTELPCNLYNVKFFNGGNVGYMIGSAGILLRKVFGAAPAAAPAPAA
jgi:photosystem II stability/assembly factor-like uncharacterized protein